MGYYKSQEKVTKYRVRVEEYTEWIETPDREELEKPVSADTPKSARPGPKPRAEWVETDNLQTVSKSVLAGILRSKAQELDPPKATTRGYDA